MQQPTKEKKLERRHIIVLARRNALFGKAAVLMRLRKIQFHTPAFPLDPADVRTCIVYADPTDRRGLVPGMMRSVAKLFLGGAEIFLDGSKGENVAFARFLERSGKNGREVNLLCIPNAAAFAIDDRANLVASHAHHQLELNSRLDLGEVA